MTARQVAFAVLRKVEEEGAYASRALDAALAQAGALDPREAALATELVYGSLRRALQLDLALDPFSRRALRDLDPAARVALRLGAYQILFLRTPPHAAVAETVELAKKVDHGKAAGYVNAVLRALARAPSLPTPPPEALDPAGHLSAAESLPRWVAEEWMAWLGLAEARRLAAAMNEPAPLSLRSPRPADLLERLTRAGVEARPAPRSPHGVLVSAASVQQVSRAAGGVPFQVQDESAQIVSLYAFAELTGEKARVLDLCAAPGGKSFHAAEILGPGSEVVAVELHPRKADALRREAAERGLAGVRVVCADGAHPVPGLEPGSFDAVLVDAPCAGLGTLRRHPELKLRRQPADLARFAAIQRPLLETALGYAHRGAPVTYSVCSLSRAEGPEVVAGALARSAGRASAPPSLPGDVLTDAGDLLLLPHRHGGDGFYAARLVGA